MKTAEQDFSINAGDDRPQLKEPFSFLTKRFIKSALARNRLLYGIILGLVLVFTWLYGEPLLYISLYVLLLLPLFSYLLTLVMLRGLSVTQSTSQSSLVKEEPGIYTIRIINRTPLMYAHIACNFQENHFAVVTDRKLDSLFARPFMHEVHKIPFRVKYRGEYKLGLRTLTVNDLTGLFTLKRKLHDVIELTVLPRVADLSYFPLAANLLSQAHSNFEIREEDYAIVSDIRPYLPSDSIKRVHWKLTAKKLEWLVKNFQSNALNKITVILDNARLFYTPELTLAMEDNMLEFTLGLVQYCLLHGMPVEFVVGGYIKKEGRNQSDFEGIYHMASGINFDARSDAVAMIDKCINESTSYINMAIATAAPDALLYERVVTANHTGNFVAVVYFAPPKPEPEAEAVYYRLVESGVACYRAEVTTH